MIYMALTENVDEGSIEDLPLQLKGCIMNSRRLASQSTSSQSEINYDDWDDYKDWWDKEEPWHDYKD